MLSAVLAFSSWAWLSPTAADAQIFGQPYAAPSGLGGFMQGIFGSAPSSAPPVHTINPPLTPPAVSAPPQSLMPRAKASSKPRPAEQDDEETPRQKSRSASASLGGGLRTMCVRLCDGFYWPMTYDARRSRLDHDAKLCQASCTNEARLFVMPNSGEAKEMVDQQGRPYSKLPNAFKYRKTAANACTCKANPWDGDAQSRHESFAEKERPRRVAEAEAAVDKIVAAARAKEDAEDGAQKAAAQLATMSIGEFPLVDAPTIMATRPEAAATTKQASADELQSRKRERKQAKASSENARRQAREQQSRQVQAQQLARATQARHVTPSDPGIQPVYPSRVQLPPGYGAQPYVIGQPRTYPYRTY